MTKEQRRQALDFGKIRGTGMPVPSGMIGSLVRPHVLNLYFESPPTPPSVSWRNRSLIGATWQNRTTSSSSWTGKSLPSTNWQARSPIA